jgi:hypothetical protein
LHIENCNVCKSSNTYHTRHKQAIPSLAPKKTEGSTRQTMQEKIWNTKTLFTAMHGFKSKKKKKKKTARIQKKKKKAPWLQMNKKKKKMAWIQKKKAPWI